MIAVRQIEKVDDNLVFFCLHLNFEQAGLGLFDYSHLIVSIVYGVRHCLQKILRVQS
jgi:hypothetical protein